MARTKQFDIDTAMEAAIGIFSVHGYAGTSASLLTQGMGIGRQSLYDTFGDKWKLYCAAVKIYGQRECEAHIQALAEGKCVMDGLRAMLSRVVQTAHQPCLGISSTSEFGTSSADLLELRNTNSRTLHKAIVKKIELAKSRAEISSKVDVQHASYFIVASIATIRLSARAGAELAALRSIAEFSLKALE